MKEKETKRTKRSWPTKAAMEQVYAMKLWGSGTSDFYSGDGSHDPDIVNPYISALTSFLTSFKNPLTVCDLGCGDFNVGKQLVPFTKKYVGVDIVPSLIARNKVKFTSNHLEFHCLDIATDDLPSGDCAILRQVLQHLSNSEVQKVLPKLSNFRYVVLTEHLPKGSFISNRDIISGQGTRLKKQSGLRLLAPPFCLKVKKEKQLLAVVPRHHTGIIVTTVYHLF